LNRHSWIEPARKAALPVSLPGKAQSALAISKIISRPRVIDAHAGDAAFTLRLG